MKRIIKKDYFSKRGEIYEKNNAVILPFIFEHSRVFGIRYE